MEAEAQLEFVRSQYILYTFLAKVHSFLSNQNTYNNNNNNNMIIIIYTNKCTIISLLNIHHAYMFRPKTA
jgi:hypothetical protein